MRIMSNQIKSWSKAEMQVYILLLCANADSKQTQEELEVIKAKTDADTFEKMYTEFSEDTEEVSLQKIQENLVNHEYSHKELVELRKEMFEVFFSDKKFSRMEKTLDKILNNILY
jgi:disulfide oxidoreductase YuzD